jgi:hypothetical protein
MAPGIQSPNSNVELEVANRPKNIRIDLVPTRVRFYLLCFNSTGNFCHRGAICSRGVPVPPSTFKNYLRHCECVLVSELKLFSINNVESDVSRIL